MAGELKKLLQEVLLKWFVQEHLPPGGPAQRYCLHRRATFPVMKVTAIPWLAYIHLLFRVTNHPRHFTQEGAGLILRMPDRLRLQRLLSLKPRMQVRWQLRMQPWEKGYEHFSCILFCCCSEVRAIIQKIRLNLQLACITYWESCSVSAIP